jgi:hypothetical protein
MASAIKLSKNGQKSMDLPSHQGDTGVLVTENEVRQHEKEFDL